MSDHQITRTAFVTSRQLDFLSEKELTAQCGHRAEHWPHVVVKELADNALDELEERGIAPEITITVDTDETGSGRRQWPRHPSRHRRPALDFSRARVQPRGVRGSGPRRTGQRASTILAMPFVLDGERGRVDIVGGGLRTEITIGIDRLAQRPVAVLGREPFAGLDGLLRARLVTAARH